MPLAKPGGFPRLAAFHMGLYFSESANCESQSKIKDFCQLPLAREPQAVPAANFPRRGAPGGNFARQLSANRYSPDPPGIVLCAISGFFMLSIDSVGMKHPEKKKPKRGQRLKLRTRAKAKGQPPDGSSRGILKGGTIRAGASYSPLEPASLLTFLPEQESKALLASTCRRLIGEQAKRL